MRTKPPLQLLDQDGNALFILDRARRAARRAGWTDDEWAVVREEAKSGDYNHLLQTLMEHFETR